MNLNQDLPEITDKLDLNVTRPGRGSWANPELLGSKSRCGITREEVAMSDDNKTQPLCMDIVNERILGGKLPGLMGKAVENFLCLPQLNEAYDSACRWMNGAGQDSNIFDALLDKLGVNLEITDEDLERIPRDGPLLVVANHPCGGLDGLALGSILAKRRPDFRILVNSFVSQFEGFRPWFLEVDVFEEKDANARNLGALLEAARWLKQGGCLGVFPAGEVSSWSWKALRVEDPEWNHHAAALSRMTDAATLPISFEGANGPLFQGIGLIHPRLRTVMLGRELWNKRGCLVKTRVGEPIPASRLKGFTDGQAATNFLRVTVDALRAPKVRPAFRLFQKPNVVASLVNPVPPEDLTSEIQSLADESILVRKGDFTVYCIQSSDAPKVMREIGRLRELTFRSVGEGTGTAVDLDVYDDHYHQLFVWDEKERAIAGGYRIGVVSDILPRLGRKGMYATSEFSIRRGFYKAIGPAAELGRSFIPPAYQRKFSLLGLLWRGVGEFLNRRPDLHVLYGPVTISADYSHVSRKLMVRYLRRNEWSPEIAVRARSKHRFRSPPLSPALKKWVRDEGRRLDEVSALISGVEPDGKGVPVLVKHYLKLNGSFVSFGVDPNFSDALDGLIVVDVRNMDDAHLRRYFGQGGFERISQARNNSVSRLTNNTKTSNRYENA